ncbi:hypothetical protein HFN71_28835 [Rhizobium laguerreae]|uniref:hypothetical protein n=1 Tax=Rhizobium laguerreae TaxID=1076926 RepID=UPI001C8FCA43|nr:hypothetical protein [Rhizobium laguerreae]MBY3543691.1 hypothetical protein [Rhizobium laguerreae]
MTTSTTARLIILNTCWAALVVWASVMGYVGFVFNGDKSYASYVIAAVLVAAVVSAFRGNADRLPDATMVCSALGLGGTFVGLASSLYGFDVSSAASPDVLADIGSRIIGGMPMALCSSMAGLAASLWIGSMGMLRGVRAWPC